MTTFKAEFLHLYLVGGTQNMPAGQSFLASVETALQAGVTMFQWREKGAGSLQDAAERRELGQALRALTRRYNVPLVVDDDWRLALDIEADGIHVGQGDDAIADVLANAGELFVGLSVGDEAELARANQVAGLSHIGIGPVFATQTKADARPALGVAELAKLVAASELPSVAIGGIDATNVLAVRETGVAGVAVISAILWADDVAQAVTNLL